MVNPRDREVVRRLAAQVAEVAAHPAQEDRRRRWYAHNALQPGRPMIFCSPEGAWSEILPASVLECQDAQMRSWEYGLRMRLYAWEHFADDQVVDAVFSVGAVTRTTGWGLEPIDVHSGVPRGAYTWEAPVKTEADLDRLSYPVTTVDREATQRLLDLAHDTFDGILEVRQHNGFWWTLGLIGEWARLRGLQQIMLDMIERPAFTHKAMAFLMQGRLSWLQALEDQGLLSLNNGNHYVGSGGFGFTTELPAPGFAEGHVRTRDMWGFAEAQEISGVSPAMHEEFVLRYQLPLLERFGLNCYGCCEPLDRKFEMVKKVPRLRRVSVSPWCNRAEAAEQLGAGYIYSWKPNPADIAAVTFQPDRVRAYIRETLSIARGCVLEIVLKDTHTCNNEPARFDQWTRIAREEVDRL
jgi:hypothetical protein